jgi:hypothetical protein
MDGVAALGPHGTAEGAVLRLGVVTDGVGDSGRAVNLRKRVAIKRGLPLNRQGAS